MILAIIVNNIHNTLSVYNKSISIVLLCSLDIQYRISDHNYVV